MLIRGDARAIPLRDGCVACVVTSPPYWGLRDYGTASWTGGDPMCDHRRGEVATSPDSPSVRFSTLNCGQQYALKTTAVAQAVKVQYRDVCGTCGARRIDSQIGLEPTPDAYVQTLVAVFREVRRVLKDDGTVWLNLGDTYAPNWSSVRPTGGGGFKADQTRQRWTRIELAPKQLVGVPWRVAFALQADGWYLRSDIIWAKPNPMPESVTDRPTKAHEYVFLLSKQARYYYDADAIAEPLAESTLREADQGYEGEGLKDYAFAGVQNPSDVKRRIVNRLRSRMVRANIDTHGGNQGNGSIPTFGQAGLQRNKRSVWTINTECYPESHFATFPEALVEPCILAGCPPGGLVLDPFCGTGTVLAVANRLDRRSVGVDLTYQDLARTRTRQRGLRFTEVSA